MYDIKAEEKEHYLYILAGGDYDVSAMQERLEGLKAWAKRTRKFRVLINTLDLALPKNDFDKFIVGEAFGRLAKPPLKIAIVSPTEMVNKFLEDTAVNRGASVFVSTKLGTAVEWLLSDLPE